MEQLFNKEVRVNEEQFDELMELLEEKTEFNWGPQKPTRWTPEELISRKFIYIQFWNDYKLSHFKTKDDDGKFDLITFEDLKHMLHKDAEKIKDLKEY